jgi:ectoine hydroxylase-related dioxygenase (phytanoyl-CoA dioxygenase family)
VKALRDSTRQASDGELLRLRMREEGYVFIRGVIDPELIRKVRADVLDVLREARWIAADGALQPLAGGQEDPRYWAGFGGVQSVESFHQLAYDSRIAAIMSALIGADVYPWPAKAPYMIWPERLAGPGGRHAGPHQEGVRWSPDVLSTWISIGRTPIEKGPLAVLPGSQRLGYLPGYGYGQFEFGPDWATSPFEPGDIIVFHNFTLHGSLPNQTDALRLSCAIKWQSARYPAPEEGARPVRHPGVPGWDSLTARWSSTKWITPPANATFTRNPPKQPGAPRTSNP